jgi:uncharacterized membrane protein
VAADVKIIVMLISIALITVGILLIRGGSMWETMGGVILLGNGYSSWMSAWSSDKG